MFLLGYDIGSSSVKAALVDADTGACVSTAFYPKDEMAIVAREPGWAEQEPTVWWECLKSATREVMHAASATGKDIRAIGISYQMHGLVVIDNEQQVLRPSIIWCDGRAVGIGNEALDRIGAEQCLVHLLNSPGNFTASKLKWVKENEPDLFARIDRVLLPGDYVAMRLTGEATTTISGLSEGIMWDFAKNRRADFLLEHYGIGSSLIAPLVPTFGDQGTVTASAARELGLAGGIPVTYRAGDQPNNALSLDVLEPGEVAATAGTSGVIYGISEEVAYDPESRVNTFAHVNHDPDKQVNRLGILLCVSGTGILNSWLRKHVCRSQQSYEEMNALGAEVAIGAEGLSILPFGNGAERMLGNRDIGARMAGLNFNTHHEGHVIRAAHEGIAFSFRYGMDIMGELGFTPGVIRAGNANMFLSPIFRETLAGISGVTIDLYDTDGAVGAARGAGVGCGHYASFAEAFAGLERIATVEPQQDKLEAYQSVYEAWRRMLDHELAGQRAP